MLLQSTTSDEAREDKAGWVEWEFNEQELQREEALMQAQVPWSRKRCAILFNQMKSAQRILKDIRREAGDQSCHEILASTEKTCWALDEIVSIVAELEGREDGKGQLTNYWRILDVLRKHASVIRTSWTVFEKDASSLSIEQDCQGKYKALKRILRKSIKDHPETGDSFALVCDEQGRYSVRQGDRKPRVVFSIYVYPPRYEVTESLAYLLLERFQKDPGHRVYRWVRELGDSNPLRGDAAPSSSAEVAPHQVHQDGRGGKNRDQHRAYCLSDRAGEVRRKYTY